MRVQDVMTTEVAKCRPETNLAEAIASMWEKNCGVLPVVGQNGEVLGMITDRDIGVALGTRNVRASELLVRDVAKDHVLTCMASDDIHVAMRLMREGKVRRLPVVASDGLVGILSTDDLVMSAQPVAKLGAAISYGDVVGVLHDIYCANEQRCQRSTAA